MARINEHYLKLKAGYLFPEIGRRVKAYAEANPQAAIIRLGIGDVVKALPPSVVAAFHAGVDEMASDASFKGYGPEQGYAFLRELIVKHDFAARGAKVEADEIFISDGSKCDSGNIQEIFGLDNIICLSDPVYPVYVDTNVMAGRSGPADERGRYGGFVYLPCVESEGFAPKLPAGHVDIIYLCSPNNPTGAVLNRDQIRQWVDYARREKAIILFDAAYEAFISDPEIPHSIYEIDGAREVAIEFRSFSKTAGFTGTRCAYTVVPKELEGMSSEGKSVSIHSLWNRRHCTKFNGVSFPVQRAAAACFSSQGQREVQALIKGYMENAHMIKKSLEGKGMVVHGAVNAPYIWIKTPRGLSSWDFFDELLKKVQIVGTPGSGFGASGEGYFRFSAFAHREQVVEAIKRMEKFL